MVLCQAERTEDMETEEAIRIETLRYVRACRQAGECHSLSLFVLEAAWRHRAHIHALAIARLRHVPSWDAKECLKAGA